LNGLGALTIVEKLAIVVIQTVHLFPAGKRHVPALEAGQLVHEDGDGLGEVHDRVLLRGRHVCDYIAALDDVVRQAVVLPSENDRRSPRSVLEHGPKLFRIIKRITDVAVYMRAGLAGRGHQQVGAHDGFLKSVHDAGCRQEVLGV
jgi:hypothetical protein